MAATSSPLQEASAFLDNHWRRNSVLRTVQFASAMISGIMEGRHPIAAAKLETLSSSVSNMRTMMRLMDDLPALARAVQTWRPVKGQSWTMWCADVVSVTSSQLYYPFEHIAWAADNRLLSTNSVNFWTGATVLWGVSLVASCIKAWLDYLRLSKQISALEQSRLGAGDRGERKTEKEGAPTRVAFDDLQSEAQAKIWALRGQRHLAVLTIVQCLSDMFNAVHWMPPGFLWGGTFSKAMVGLFGTVSSLIDLYKHFI